MVAFAGRMRPAVARSIPQSKRRAQRRLQEADVIFYEAGLHDGILELARRDAERTACRYDACSLPALAHLLRNPLSDGKNVGGPVLAQV